MKRLNVLSQCKDIMDNHNCHHTHMGGLDRNVPPEYNFGHLKPDRKYTDDGNPYKIQLITLICILMVILVIMSLALIMPPSGALVIYLFRKCKYLLKGAKNEEVDNFADAETADMMKIQNEKIESAPKIDSETPSSVSTTSENSSSQSSYVQKENWDPLDRCRTISLNQIKITQNAVPAPFGVGSVSAQQDLCQMTGDYSSKSAGQELPSRSVKTMSSYSINRHNVDYV